MSTYESLRAQIEAHEAEEARLIAEVDALRARAEAAEARAAQAEADARLMLHELVALDESEGTNVVDYWRGLGLTDAECDALRGAFDRSPPGREEEELAVVRRILAGVQP